MTVHRRILVLALICLVSACSRHTEETTIIRKKNAQQRAVEGKQGRPSQRRGRKNVKELFADDITIAQKGLVVDKLPLSGTLSAIRQADVSSESSGLIRRLLVKEGNSVKKGQVLAQVESVNSELDYANSQADLNSAEASLRLLKKKREQQLALLKEGFISKIAFAEIDNEYTRQQDTVKGVRARLAKQRIALQKTKVMAPFSGFIHERYVQEGEVVNPGSKVFGLSDISQLELTTNIPVRHIADIRLGETVNINIQDSPSIVAAKLVRINPITNNNTQTVDAYFRVANWGNLLRSGQFVQMNFPLREEKQGIRLPSLAIRGTNREKDAWVMTIDINVQKTGYVLTKRPVRVLLSSEQTQTVSVEGIKPGTLVIANELPGSKPGDAVRLPRSILSKLVPAAHKNVSPRKTQNIARQQRIQD